MPSIWRAIATVWRRRWPRRVAIVLVPLVVAANVLLWVAVTREQADCSDSESREYLRELCREYSLGALNGSLCPVLCSGEVRFVRCLGHGVKLHVLLAEWRGHSLILKTPKALGHRLTITHLDPSKKNSVTSKTEFIENANASLFHNVAGGRHSEATVELIKRTFAECDLRGDSELGYEESIACWQLLDTDEYVIFSLLQGRSGIPDVYGVCGNMYATQYAPSEPFLGFSPHLSDNRGWSLKARLALALLDMVESIEDTEWGTLYLCDIQESNFGVVQRDGRLLGKAIDVDISWFEQAMLRAVAHPSETGKECSSGKDCDFVMCQVPCDGATGTCSGRLTSNNLKTLCLRIFQYWSPSWHTPLLVDPPEAIREDLEGLLEACVQSTSIHIPAELLGQLRSLLLSSINLK